MVGGIDHERNLAPVCADCHALIHQSNFVKLKSLQRLGIEKAKKLGKYKGRKAEIDRLQVAYLNTKGLSTYEIAATMNISRMSVHRILNKEGLKNVKVHLKEKS